MLNLIDRPIFRLPNGDVITDETYTQYMTHDAYLGEGVSRKVYRLDDRHVLKVMRAADSFAGGNRQEFAAYWRIPAVDRVYFAASLMLGTRGKWLIAEKCSTYCNQHGLLRDVGSRYGIKDLHAYNVGSRETDEGTEPVILDYAFQSGGSFDASSFEGGFDEEECDCTRCNIGHERGECQEDGFLCTYCHGGRGDCEDVWCDRCHPWSADCTDVDCGRHHFECSPVCEVCHPPMAIDEEHFAECSACLAEACRDAMARRIGDVQPALFRYVGAWMCKHGTGDPYNPQDIANFCSHSHWTKYATGWRHFAIGDERANAARAAGFVCTADLF